MNKGFTMIEIIVVIAVMMILSAVLMIGQNLNRDKLALQQAAVGLAEDLRHIQEKAMGAVGDKCVNNPDFDACGFGFIFDKQHSDYYVAFLDCAQNCDSSNRVFTGQDDLLLGPITLNSKVKICDLSPYSSFEVTFAPPDPITYLKGNNWGQEVEIMVCLKSNPSLVKKIKVNNAGRIEIE